MNRLVLILLLSFFFGDSVAQQKKALIVAVSNYPAASGFRAINSNNDIPLIKDALHKLGFEDKNITVLKDTNATKRRILEEMELKLVKGTSPGDIAFFHFSGHGQQVQDTSGDEPDGYDEALVPYDAMQEFKSGVYEGQNHIIDDELNIEYSKIRTNLGPTGHFLCTIDACHSGTSTRGIGIARGTDIPMASADFMAHKRNKKSDNSELDAVKDETKMAPIVAFFGAMANQLNYEVQAEDNKTYGALSFAFSKAINSLTQKSSYQQVFDRIRLTISGYNSNQTPESAGILAQPVLGGKYESTPDYFLIREWHDETTVVIDGGFLKSITPGTVIGFFKPDTRDLNNTNLITKGTVVEAGPSNSLVQVPDSIKKKHIEFAWAIVMEENFGDVAIKLQCKIDTVHSDTILMKKIQGLPFIKIVASQADILLIENRDSILIITRNDYKIGAYPRFSTKNDLFYKIKKTITQFGQSQFLRKLEQENKSIGLIMNFIPVSRKGVKFRDGFSQDSLRDESGNIVLQNKDVIKVVITNTGTQKAFYSLLDIQPDNVTNVLCPRPTESPSDYMVEPGKKDTIGFNFTIGPPYGAELFKLIASRNEFDLRKMDQKRSISGNLRKDPFELLIDQTYYQDDTGTRGTKSQNVPAGQVNIQPLHFIIKE